MARTIFTLFFFMTLVFEPASIFAQENLSGSNEVVNDTYISGSNVKQSMHSPRDLFASGFSVIVDGKVTEDAHIAGFDVEVERSIGKNLYVAGARVSIEGAVGEDLTAAGYKVRLKHEALVGGNTRIAAGNLIIDAPLSGNLIVASSDVALNATIAGDVKITASRISFGENAKIRGYLTYSAPEKIEIPASVVDKDRVEFKPLSSSTLLDDLIEQADQTESFLWISLAGLVAMFVISFLFFILVSAAFLSFKPALVERLRNDINGGLGSSLLAGIIGLSILLGLIPVAMMTIVGLLLIPIILIVGIGFWILGYLLGTYAVFWRIANSIGVRSDSVPAKLMIVAVGIVSLALVKFIPLIGWLVNLIVLLLGLGAINKLLMRKVAN